MKLAKTYEPKLYEDNIYKLWEKSDVFKPNRTGKPFAIVMPPPNANGDLHIGHELTIAIEDIVIRHHRALGDSSLLIPGADHAGFETQSVYEKILSKEGKSRFDFTREELYSRIWQFVALNRQNFATQLRKMGASCDWDSFTYTLDENVIKRVYKTFKKMWEEGLIYRDERLVNYCTFHQTGFADIEVVYKEAKTPLYYLKYGPFVLATTRPETKFGDTAVAVHPDDKRYKKYVGKVIEVEGVNGKFSVQVIADKMVDPVFGTGVVKITPAHSFDDWEVAQRHNLPLKRVINHDGTMNHEAGRFAGMSILKARQAVVEALKEQGLLVKVDDQYKNRVGHCYKCDTIIEPMLMEQWFVSMESLVKPAITKLTANEIKFYPLAKRDQLIGYLQNLKDWNISRQIAWGIPIPAFQNVDDQDDWIYDERVDREIITIKGKTYRRDPDVFDTWFSSSAWPYVTLGFPNGVNYKDFYPLGLMETGGEILYPWVSRMIMLGLYTTENIPFKAVYIHGYVMAEDGSKMSKSIGNVVSPMPVIEKYGSDALRMGIIWGRSAAINSGYDQRRVEEARNFNNKVWNISRYILDLSDQPNTQEIKPKTDADHWILNKLSIAQKQIINMLSDYQFSEAFETLYHFIWDDFADWYIEASKISPRKSFLLYILEAILIDLHPFAPFLTETIWQTIKDGDGTLIAQKTYMDIAEFDNLKVRNFSEIKKLISEIRSLTKLFKTTTLTLNSLETAVISNENLIKRLSGVKKIAQDKGGIIELNSLKNTWLEIDHSAALDYQDKLTLEITKIELQIKQLKTRLTNKNYLSNAPEKVVDQTKDQLNNALARLEVLKTDLKQIKTA